ncbi:Cof-type HAD-IIB family hydrolase [Salisediminibacterium halotolerans]|uniref:Cof-type HAD-IIB family hydrolase n=1 Tax=Salisediminibacterium halotolerans TaxID=517425 RepID=UPI000EB08F6F|nr:Cof-type HAD-IIB family hydrolase [Salisediminibacterium halotolerans]RLJ78014.1 hypothetical protein BCL39_0478 [Actinophytocola xinjiangensis]RPE88648.1 hypothetical protein EDD67_0981 [Salisediminibacterium halotolerans]TWG36991.1 hypothetical protein BCL52_0477 [Salisediminibacterium halotolerans]GEL08474.1 haloacid dehalogenase [Salisediminibacterium halotolerans]
MKSRPWIVTDMDGTLLNDGRSISAKNVDAINKALEADIQVVIATGRDYFEANAPLVEAGLQLPIICGNGSELRDNNHAVLHRQTLDHAVFSQIETTLNKFDMYFEIFTTSGSFTNNKEKGFALVADMLLSTGHFASPEKAREFAELRFTEGMLKETGSYSTLLTTEGIDLFKVLAFSKDAVKRKKVIEELEKVNVTLTSSGDDNIEIMHPCASKGRGVKQMADKFNLNPADAVVIGDNENDRSMMETAGTAVAVANALPAIQEISDFVTLANTEDGVASVIENVLTNIVRA